MRDPRLMYKNLIRVLTVPVWRPVATRETSFSVIGNLGLKTHTFVRFQSGLRSVGRRGSHNKGENTASRLIPRFFARKSFY